MEFFTYDPVPFVIATLVIEHKAGIITKEQLKQCVKEIEKIEKEKSSVSQEFYKLMHSE